MSHTHGRHHHCCCCCCERRTATRHRAAAAAAIGIVVTALAITRQQPSLTHSLSLSLSHARSTLAD